MIMLNANGRLLLGITEENVARLRDGKPMLVRASMVRELGLPNGPLEIAIVLGETQRSLIDDLHDGGIFSDQDREEQLRLTEEAEAHHGGRPA